MIMKFISILMISESKNKRFKTNWEYLISIWNDNNSDTAIDENIEIPDYNLLSDKL